MNRLLTYYNFIIVSLVVTGGFLSAQTPAQLATAIFFFPLLLYFTLKVLPKKNKAIILPSVENIPPPPGKKKIKSKKVEKAEVVKIAGKDFDKDRRAFVKLIGSAGLSVFIFSVFGIKRANAAFFGSVPGPGIVGIKDSAGTRIDPAIIQPTDGYRIAELDDSIPAYYGFTDKDGAWFIMEEDSTGAYRYIKGASDFTNATTGWPNRTNLSYDYFENVF